MSRIERFFRLFYNIDPDGRHIFGQAGEEYAKNKLSHFGYHLFFNRILPHPKNPSRYIESDIIVYSDDYIFCIEVKRFRGKVFFTDGGIIQETHRAFERRYRGYRAKKIKDPMVQSTLFTKTLKYSLIGKDSRFKKIHFVPVVAFSEEADISSIHSFGDGILYVSELPDFIQSCLKKNDKYEWVVKAFESLKGFDYIINRNGFTTMGIILNKNFECRSVDKVFSLPYAQIKKINVKRGGLFSKCDKITILKKNSEVENLCCMDGYILINIFGNKQKHFLKNILKAKIESL